MILNACMRFAAPASALVLLCAAGQLCAAETAKAPCPSIAKQESAVGKVSPSGTETPPAQPMERSGILPSAGGEGSSAAPSVQQQGVAVSNGTDCPLAPDHPNALKQTGPLPQPSVPTK